MGFVSYLRVSTDRQGKSGLGLEAQRESVARHVASVAGVHVTEFVEVESGRKNDRPELARAIKECRLRGATLIIAKLDRLARNVRFVSELMDSEIDFIAADYPQANRLTIHILAAVAEHEAKMISQRVKDALAAAKARGVKLGKPENLSNSAVGSVRGNLVKQAKAQKRAVDTCEIIADINKGGDLSIRMIAKELNQRGIQTARGGTWSATQVSRVMKQMPASAG